jgi:hypothetical protein
MSFCENVQNISTLTTALCESHPILTGGASSPAFFPPPFLSSSTLSLASVDMLKLPPRAIDTCRGTKPFDNVAAVDNTAKTATLNNILIYKCTVKFVKKVALKDVSFVVV